MPKKVLKPLHVLDPIFKPAADLLSIGKDVYKPLAQLGGLGVGGIVGGPTGFGIALGSMKFHEGAQKISDARDIKRIQEQQQADAKEEADRIEAETKAYIEEQQKRQDEYIAQQQAAAEAAAAQQEAYRQQVLAQQRRQQALMEANQREALNRENYQMTQKSEREREYRRAGVARSRTSLSNTGAQTGRAQGSIAAGLQNPGGAAGLGGGLFAMRDSQGRQLVNNQGIGRAQVGIYAAQSGAQQSATNATIFAQNAQRQFAADQGSAQNYFNMTQGHSAGLFAIQNQNASNAMSNISNRVSPFSIASSAASLFFPTSFGGGYTPTEMDV